MKELHLLTVLNTGMLATYQHTKWRGYVMVHLPLMCAGGITEGSCNLCAEMWVKDHCGISCL